MKPNKRLIRVGKIKKQKKISLTQYMMPNGRKVTVTTDVEDQIADMAEGMILTCEVLSTGGIALYAKYPEDKEEEESIEISSNGPEVSEALQRLIKHKYEENQSNMNQKGGKNG